MARPELAWRGPALRLIAVAGLIGCGHEPGSLFDGEDDPSGHVGPGGGPGDPDPDPDDPPTTEVPSSWASFEQDVIDLVNLQRAAGATCAGFEAPAPPLALDVTLREVARAHSEDMATRGFFDHVNPDGDDPFDRMDAAGFTGALPWGENIAGGSPTPESVMQGWMASDGHCENIMNPDYTVIGVGYFERADDPQGLRHYWTQNFAASH